MGKYGYNNYSTRWRVAFSPEQYLTVEGKIFHGQYHNASVANGSSVTMGISVPTNYYPRGFFDVTSDGGITVEIFEGSTYTGGTTINAINMDRNSSATDHMTIVHSPTVTDEGTLLDIQYLGGSGFHADVPGLTQSTPMALKVNTKYIIKVTNTSGDASKIAVGIYFTEQVP